MSLRISAKSLQVVYNLLKGYSDDNPTTYYTDLAAYVPSTEDFELKDRLLLPNVLLWDPLTKIPSLELKCPHCAQDGVKISTVRKMLGNKWELTGPKPRAIWDRGWYCALVGRSYVCILHNHRVASFHFGFLQQIPANLIPFILTHQTGITSACFDDIVRYVENGSNFQTIQNILAGNILETYERRKLCYVPPNGMITTAVGDIPEGNECLPFITDTLIRTLYLVQFEINKKVYQAQFDKIKCQQLHFATNCSPKNSYGVNVGYMKNGKWLQVFSTLFLIFNEQGFVNAYGFGSSNEQASDLLISLAPENPDIELVLFDSNCCRYRDEIMQAFPKAEVKYDLNHAVCSIRRHIENKTENADLRLEVELLFRQQGDSTKENMRKFPTADPATILKNIDLFVTKWHDSLNNLALYEIESLKLHVSCGCLSNIPATYHHASKAKAFNKLTSVFKQGEKVKRVTVETACALVTHLLYVHNCERNGETFHKPIWSHRGLDVPGSYYQEVESITIDSSFLEDDSQRLATNESSLDQTGESPVSVETPIFGPLTERSEAILGVIKLFRQLMEKFEPLPKTRQHSFLPFVSLNTEVWDLRHYFDVCRRSWSLLPVEQIALQSTLNLCIYGDSCSDFFYSVWRSLNSMLDNQAAAVIGYRSMLVSKGLLTTDNCKTADQIVEHLRKLINQQIMGSNKKRYLDMVDNTEKFLLNPTSEAVASIDALKLMLHALSDLLGLVIVLVPPNRVLPLLPVFPYYELYTEFPLFIHVDKKENSLIFKALVKKKEEKRSKSHELGPCHCGTREKSIPKKKNSRKKCMLSKCNCRVAQRNCTSLCRCFDCGNGKPKVKEIPNELKEVDNKKKPRRSRFFKQIQTLKEALESPKVIENLTAQNNDGVSQMDYINHQENSNEGDSSTPVQVAEISTDDIIDNAAKEKLETLTQNVVFEAIVYILMVEMKTIQKDITDVDLAASLARAYQEFYEELEDSERLVKDNFLSNLKKLERDDPTFVYWVSKRRKTSNGLYKMRDELNVDSTKNINTTKEAKDVKKGAKKTNNAKSGKQENSKDPNGTIETEGTKEFDFVKETKVAKKANVTKKTAAAKETKSPKEDSSSKFVKQPETISNETNSAKEAECSKKSEDDKEKSIVIAKNTTTTTTKVLKLVLEDAKKSINKAKNVNSTKSTENSKEAKCINKPKKPKDREMEGREIEGLKGPKRKKTS